MLILLAPLTSGRFARALRSNTDARCKGETIEMRKSKLACEFSLVLVLALMGPFMAHSQTTTVTSRESNFEIIAVEGNELVVSDQLGTRALTVPPDFKFMVDGKPLGVSDLRAGMKGTAVVTTTTTQRPVYVTTIKKGTVISQVARSIQIKEDDTGKMYKFTQSEIDKRGVRLYPSGSDKPTKLSQLDPGDTIRATIVTESQPEILTAQAVDAQLAAEPAPVAAAPAPEPEPVADAAPATEAPAEPAAEPAAEPTPEPVAMDQAAPAPVAEEAAPMAEAKPFYQKPLFLILLGLIVVSLIWMMMRRKDDKN